MMRDPENWREFVGKGDLWYVQADLFDSLNQIIRVSGNWKKGKAPKFDPYPRPGRDEKGEKKTKKKKKRKTLADLYGSMANPLIVQPGDDIWSPQME